MTEPKSQRAELAGQPTAGQRLGRWIREGGWRAIGGAVVGASLLAAYSYFVGCRTGTCILTANVQTAIAVGGVVGLVMGWPAPAKATEQVRR